ncbi:hypothetical protein GCM10009557_08070 [Virgisporangium ochraceum]|uniref:Uncharacterized protein n=1 Tax=Virgisporangium ochraceum TaxID=65505 RepID=A0A8J4EC84_9ACTN|nr:hypothetical protein Voc01_015140 [Virgisporangium ochraceum]
MPRFFAIDVGEAPVLDEDFVDVFGAVFVAAPAASCAGDIEVGGVPDRPVSSGVARMSSPMPVSPMSALVRPLAPSVPCAAGEDGVDVEYVAGLDVLLPECVPDSETVCEPDSEV